VEVRAGVDGDGGQTVSILTKAEIIALWLVSGGSISSAPDALARALSESSGSTSVTSSNPGGVGCVNVGLYQLATPCGVGSGYTVAQLQNPYLNTQITVKATNNGANWSSWADNWTAFLTTAQTAVSDFESSAGGNLTAYAEKLLANVTTAGGGGSATTGGSGGSGASGGGGTVAAAGGFSPSTFFSDANDFFGDAAKVLDSFFSLWYPGNPWRIVFGAGAVVAFVHGVRSWRDAATADNPGAALPLALALFGLAALAAFFALRPWPQVDGKPVKPGFYAAMTLAGTPPQAGPARTADVTEIKYSLETVVGLWAAQQAAETVLDLAGTAQDVKNTLFGWWGDLF
jgi:hypothetical protein